MRTFTSLRIPFEYVVVGKLPTRRVIRRKLRSWDLAISRMVLLHNNQRTKAGVATAKFPNGIIFLQIKYDFPLNKV